MVAIPASETIDKRFAQLIQQFGLTKNSFAISLGKTASVIQHLIDGRNKPGYDLLCKVFEIYPNVSRDWLLLGRGPMLVSGEHAPKSAPAPVASAAEVPLEPIDLSELELPTPRRNAAGGARLQPAEIAATIALAAVASQLARATEPTQASGPVAAPQQPAADPAPAQPAAPHTAQAAEIPAPAVVTSPQPAPAAPPTAASALPPTAMPATASSSPESYVAAALHAQHLQHQLALAELRNQHLLEQQQMLREMLAMARQAMV